MNDRIPKLVSSTNMKPERKTDPQCLVCRAPLVLKRLTGRPPRYCDGPECRRVMRQARDRAYDERRKAGLVHSPHETLERPLTPLAPPSPLSWWIEQAEAIQETCRVCAGPVVGVYVAPTVETMGECAVVAHCRVCARERMVLAGRGGVPYTEQGPGQLRGPRQVARRMNTSRRRGPYERT